VLSGHLPSRRHLNDHSHCNFRLIIHQLHENDRTGFLALRQTSRSLRQQSEAIMFRQLVFRGAGLENGILARLHDTTDGLAAHVETLEVSCLEDLNLTDAWECLVDLKAFVCVTSVTLYLLLTTATFCTFPTNMLQVGQHTRTYHPVFSKVSMHVHIFACTSFQVARGLKQLRLTKPPYPHHHCIPSTIPCMHSFLQPISHRSLRY
jgi:hypothetical protein